jgi:hypothetical protein
MEGTEGEHMRRRVKCHMTTILVTLGLLSFGKGIAAGDHLFEAMGMARLPGKPATDFTLPDLEGKQVSLQHYRGRLIFLWARVDDGPRVPTTQAPTDVKGLLSVNILTGMGGIYLAAATANGFFVNADCF